MNGPDASSACLDDDDLPIVILPDHAESITVPASVLHELVEFAQRSIQRGDGLAALTKLGLAHPDIVAAYGIGYLSSSVLDAVPQALIPWVTEHHLQDVVLIPAYDEKSRVVDALVLTASGERRYLEDIHRGLLGKVLTNEPTELLVVRELSELAKYSVQSCQLVRDLSDLTDNLHRFQHVGVERIRLGFDLDDTTFTHLSQTCAAVSIAVVRHRDDTTPTLQVVSYDKDTRQAVFSSGTITVSCSVPLVATAPTNLHLRNGQNHHRDTFRIDVDAQRERFARAAHRRLQVDATVITQVLTLVADELKELVEPTTGTNSRAMVTETTVTDEAVHNLLTSGDILSRFLADCTAAGWIGDDQLKRLVLLTLAGRHTESPLWLLLNGESSETLPIIARIAELIPTESRLQPNHVTKHWFSQHVHDLDGRMLFLDNADQLPREFVADLRRFQAHGSIAVPTTARNPTTGRMESVVRHVAGSLGVIAATTTMTPLDDVFLRIPVTRSPTDIAQRIDAERVRRRGSSPSSATRPAPLALWCSALSTIPRLPVASPWTDRLVFPATHSHHARDYDQFCALVEASALLHHRQRTQVDGWLVSTDADVHNAIQASVGILGTTTVNLSADAVAVLTMLDSVTTTEPITIPWLSKQLPARSFHQIRHVVDELESNGRVTVSHAGRGRRAGTIQVIPDPSRISITLLPPGQTAPTAAELIARQYDHPFVRVRQEVAHG